MKVPKSITIKDKQIMPNNKDGIKEPIIFDKKTNYTVTWLDKHDEDYRPKHDILVQINEIREPIPTDRNVVLDELPMPPQKFYLYLNWRQSIKMKIIWEDYWILKNNRIRKAIFFVISATIGAFIAKFVKA